MRSVFELVWSMSVAPEAPILLYQSTPAGILVTQGPASIVVESGELVLRESRELEEEN